MNAKKCDRCGRYFDPIFSISEKITEKASKKLIVANYDGAGVVHYSSKSCFDLCPQCYDEITNWFDGYEPDVYKTVTDL